MPVSPSLRVVNLSGRGVCELYACTQQLHVPSTRYTVFTAFSDRCNLLAIVERTYAPIEVCAGRTISTT